MTKFTVTRRLRRSTDFSSLRAPPASAVGPRLKGTLHLGAGGHVAADLRAPEPALA